MQVSPENKSHGNQNPIAILMTMYNNEALGNRICRHLAKDFDVYVHIDKRSSAKIDEHNNVFVYKKFRTYWGSFNFVRAILYLLQQAYRKGYDRYILISGQDLPIKTNAEINEFFSNNNREYIWMQKMPVEGLVDNGGFDRVAHYHPNPFHRNRSAFSRGLYKLINSVFAVYSKIKPRTIDYEFYKGTTWWNLTHKCVSGILSFINENSLYSNRFRWTCICDEIFFHTIVSQIEGTTVVNNALRYIDWVSGPEYPRTLRLDDYERIITSDALFARKFDMNVDSSVISKVMDYVNAD